jgi:hypothetical protein
METGESWAYRKRGDDPLTEVRVLRKGDKRPARVLVQFADSNFEGKQEWVSPARLKVLWDERDVFVADEARWSAISDLAPGWSDPENFAADAVFRLLVDPALARYDSGFALVSDCEALGLLIGEPGRFVSQHSSSFTIDSGDTVAPWPTVEGIVLRLCQQHPDKVLALSDTLERDFRKRATYGYSVRMGRGEPPLHIDAEFVAEEEDETYHRPLWEKLRSWCGVQDKERYDELKALRQEVHRLGLVAQRAVTVLRIHGLRAPADNLQRELGIPVGEIESD